MYDLLTVHRDSPLILPNKQLPCKPMPGSWLYVKPFLIVNHSSHTVLTRAVLHRGSPVGFARLDHAHMSWLVSGQGVPGSVVRRIAGYPGPPTSGAPPSRPPPGQSVRTWQLLMPALPVACVLP